MSSQPKLKDIVDEISNLKKEVTFKNSNDALVLLIHFILLKDGFKPVKKNESSKKFEKIESKIPKDWNKSTDFFQFSYNHSKSKKHFVLKIVPMGNQIVVHGLIVENPNTPFGVQLKVSDFVDKENIEKIKKTFKQFDSLLKIFRTNLSYNFVPELKPVQRNIFENVQNERRNLRNDDDDDPLRVRRPQQVQRGFSFMPRNPSGMGIGSDDLNPMGSFGFPSRRINPRGGGGGGNLFGPSMFGKKKGPKKYNGIRFDPFIGEPDNDNLKPPDLGNEDDDLGFI